MRGVRVGEASHPGPRGFSRRTQERHRSRSRSAGRAAGGEEDSMLLMRLGEGPSLPTPSVLAVAAQPTTEVEIHESTIWDGSSDGEPLVRPNNGRHVASRIGDTVRDRSVYYGRFSVLSEDTANSVHSGTRRLSLMSGGVPVTQLDAVSPHEAPMEVSQFNLAQSDDDDLAEEDDVVSEGGLEILSHAPGAHGFGWWQFSSPFCRTVLRHPFKFSVGRFLWEDPHHLEGGEQGDAMMPLFFSLGQHSALARSASPDGGWGSSVGFPR